MRIPSRALLIVTAAMGLMSCEGTSRTYELPPPPALAEPTAPPPVASDTYSRPQTVYTPQPKAPSWTLMPSQRTNCGSGRFC